MFNILDMNYSHLSACMKFLVTSLLLGESNANHKINLLFSVISLFSLMQVDLDATNLYDNIILDVFYIEIFMS